MSPNPTQGWAIVNALVMDSKGGFTRRSSLGISAGRFTEFDTEPPGPHVLDAHGLWLIPGVYDCHTHISWNDFHQQDRDRRDPGERAQLTAASVTATLRGGVTSARDAGGADAALRDAVAGGRLPGPRLQIAVDMIGPAQAGSVAAIRAAAQRALDNGAQWIKLMATAGVSTPADAVLASNFSREEIKAAVEVADHGGARVMVHTWGGDSADWAVQAGAASLEHGIYLTQEQVSRAAAAGLTLVPTLTIYRHVRDMVRDGRLGGIPLPRIADVIEAHELVVRRAREAGLPLAIGSDFTLPRQHGTNLVEVGALRRAGLTSGEALLAATSNGARLLLDGGSGVIAAGHRADAVLLSGDPRDPATFENPSSVAAVVKDGILVHAEGLGD
jgi:imidazolonepropionase-like amidohydrolase